MANALFAFQDVAAAQRAAARVAAKLPPHAVRLHAKQEQDFAGKADEAFGSGGLLRNVYDLFEGIFDWGGSPHDASHYAEMVRTGGAVVSVDAKTPEEQAQVDGVATDFAFERRTGWQGA